MSQCPRCAYVRCEADSHVHPEICPACGIAYRKWKARQDPREVAAADADECASARDPGPFLPRLGAALLEIPDTVDAVSLWARAALLAGLGSWTIYFAINGIDWEVIGGSFLHSANLAFHEFGHVFFMPFGRFMAILGGSLFQVLMPLGLLLVFVLRQHDNFAAAVMLWWSGQNLVDVSPHIRDAEYRVLPLVGGRGEDSHDWGNLLTMLDALGSCYALARTSFGLGLLVMLMALAWAALLLKRCHASLAR